MCVRVGGHSIVQVHWLACRHEKQMRLPSAAGGQKNQDMNEGVDILVRLGEGDRCMQFPPAALGLHGPLQVDQAC